VTSEHTLFRRQTLGEAAVASLSRFDHPHGAPEEDSEEPAAERFQINIVERGWFQLGHRGREWTLGAGSVFLSRPGDVYRYAHRRDLEPDVCLSLHFNHSLSNDLTERFAGRPVALPPTNRLGYLGLRLASRRLHEDPILLDDLACELVDAAEEAKPGLRRLYVPEQLRSYAQRIGLAREMIDTNPGGRHTLEHLALGAAMSPFVFARLFRELNGIPPHRYVVRVRLARARALLEEGASVTETCYASGFNNLSHFIRTFQTRYGCSPSKLRARNRKRLF
jgi:AraC family transcriptional regulator